MCELQCEYSIQVRLIRDTCDKARLINANELDLFLLGTNHGSHLQKESALRTYTKIALMSILFLRV
jgi:hypothetical protein